MIITKIELLLIKAIICTSNIRKNQNNKMVNMTKVEDVVAVLNGPPFNDPISFIELR